MEILQDQILQIINLISTNGHTYKPRLNLGASHQASKVNLSNKELLKDSGTGIFWYLLS